MDPVLGLLPTLLFHATGAVTFAADGLEPSGWDDDVLFAAAA